MLQNKGERKLEDLKNKRHNQKNNHKKTQKIEIILKIKMIKIQIQMKFIKIKI